MNNNRFTVNKGQFWIHVAIVVILIIAMIGAVLVVIGANSAELAMFELITFGVGVAALLLSVLGSFNATYQMRMTRRIADEVKDAIAELTAIDRSNLAIQRRIDHDIQLSESIAEALYEAGLLDDESERQAVASKIEHKVRSHIKTSLKS